MDYEIPECKVNIYLKDTSNLLNKGMNKLRLNEAELKAISISNTICFRNTYYDIIGMTFDFDDDVLNIFVKE